MQEDERERINAGRRDRKARVKASNGLGFCEDLISVLVECLSLTFSLSLDPSGISHRLKVQRKKVVFIPGKSRELIAPESSFEFTRQFRELHLGMNFIIR